MTPVRTRSRTEKSSADGNQQTAAGLSQNRILAMLSADELADLRPHFTRVSLPVRYMVRKANSKSTTLYFPTSGMVSNVVVMENGLTVEVGIVGREGMIGISTLLGYDSAPGAMSFVQVQGEALRISAEHVVPAFNHGSGRLAAILRRYVSAQSTQLARSVACNRLHTAQQRCARWLLMTMDRVGSEFQLTHEFLGQMLGTRRATVSLEAQKLQKAGILRYHRGKMKILKRKALEQTACECYRFRDLDDFLKG
jgi:CRP-like cAMP-binding protein